MLAPGGRTDSRWLNVEALCPDGGGRSNPARAPGHSLDPGGNREGSKRSDAGFALKVEEATEVANELDGGRIKRKVGEMTARLA